jgi:DNA-binding NtrC family response regulator
VIVMTGYGTIEGAIDAMRGGAFDYMTKPVTMSALLEAIALACEQRAGRESAPASPREPGDGGTSPQPEFIGRSPRILELHGLVDKVAPTDTPVLIRGESGTGKELVANAIHNRSPRARRRFVAINCASIPETLLESELFGYEKGAFTGADRPKPGLIEMAHEGTLFLDEIGELPLALQSKLLRALQEREIQRVGAVKSTPVDFRLVAATNRDLREMMDRREFRPDLYYRLSVISVELPPLRERKGDVPLLVAHFLEQVRGGMRRAPIPIDPDALVALENYWWPGNVRELQNVLERMMVLCDSGRITLKDVPAEVRAAADAKSADIMTSPGETLEYKDAKDRFEREYLLRVIEAARGNISEAARLSGISRRHFYEKIEKLGIQIER